MNQEQMMKFWEDLTLYQKTSSLISQKFQVNFI